MLVYLTQIWQANVTALMWWLEPKVIIPVTTLSKTDKVLDVSDEDQLALLRWFYKCVCTS